MVFQMDMAFALELIALVAGTWLLIWSAGQSVHQQCAKMIAYAVMVLSVLSMLCTSYYSYKYWKAGEFKPRGKHKMMMMQDQNGMPQHMQHMQQMMQNQNMPMMQNQPMPQQGQNQGMNPMGSPMMNQGQRPNPMGMNPQQPQIPMTPSMEQDDNEN